MGSAWRNAKRALGLNLCVHVSRTMGDEKDDVVRHVVSAEGLRASDAAATTSSSPGSSMDAWEIILRMPSTPTPSSVGARISESGTRSSKIRFFFYFFFLSNADLFVLLIKRTNLFHFFPLIFLYEVLCCFVIDKSIKLTISWSLDVIC